MDNALVKAVRLDQAVGERAPTGYPWNLPAIAALGDELALHPDVTYLIGENGTGKSMLLEAIAVAASMNAEGGSSNFAFSTRDSHSTLWEEVRLIRGVRRPQTDFRIKRAFPPSAIDGLTTGCVPPPLGVVSSRPG